MPASDPLRLEGKIEIITGTNDVIDWDENATALSVTIAAGEYWPPDLIAAIKAAMDAESIASGASRTYTLTIDDATGLLTISVDASVFYPKITSSQTQKLLTGGDTGIFDERGFNHLGFDELGGHPTAAASFTSPKPIINGFHPDQPTDKDTGDRVRATVGQSIDLSGQAFTRTFTSRTNPPTFRDLTWQLIKTAARAEWLETFQAYGCTGKEFRLYKPYNGSSQGRYVLTGSSLDDPSFEEQQHHMPWWRGELHLLRVGD